MMKRQKSTRVKAPANTNPPLLPMDQKRTNDATALKLTGRFDAPPRAGSTPSRAPIGRAVADAPKEKVALLTTKCNIGIGTWNVRTLHHDGNLEILLNQMQKFRWEILGLAETHWTESGEFTIDGYKILSSGNLSVHRKLVGLILNKVAQSALLGYNPISPRLISARFQTKTGAIAIIQVYAPNTADSETCVDEFYD
ncbi:craniofacial development protein 2-like [Amphiura filiformis]|uniref:craniofacial development protein 2-like n=1 Tax=Amphiura filiformis TaxID=82378 RepID=UPI003B21D149